MSRKIMVVDDSKTSRSHVIKALQPMNLEIIEAEHGDDALKKMAGLTDLSLIISDINMPWKDGLEMLQEMSEDAELKKIPVIFVTAEASNDQIQQGKAIGLKAWMIKPINGPVLLSLVQKLLDRAAAA